MTYDAWKTTEPEDPRDEAARERRELAVAWTRAVRAMEVARTEFNECSQDPPDFPEGPGGFFNLNAMREYRDTLRDWADLPPVDTGEVPDNFTPEQRAMIARLEGVEDGLNLQGHSMEPDPDKGEEVP